jgi:hypothetical protein
LSPPVVQVAQCRSPGIEVSKQTSHLNAAAVSPGAEPVLKPDRQANRSRAHSRIRNGPFPIKNYILEIWLRKNSLARAPIANFGYAANDDNDEWHETSG